MRPLTQNPIRFFSSALLLAFALTAVPSRAEEPQLEAIHLKPPAAYQASDLRYYPSPVESEREPQRPTKGWKKAWIASWVAFAAVNILDAHSSVGRRELNPLLQNSDGTFDAKKALVIKSAVGGGFFAFQWWLNHQNPHEDYYKAFTIANSAAVAGFGYVAVHNYGIQKVGQQQAAASGAHEYLKRP